MRYTFVLKSGLFLSLVGVLIMVINYSFDYASLALTFSGAVVSLVLLIYFIREYVMCADSVRTLPGFLNYFINLSGVLFLSSFINLFFEYSLYNHIDPQYKYDLAEKEFQKVYQHRMQKGLPVNYRLPDEEVEAKYAFSGLFELNKPVYVLNFIVIFILFLPALLFEKMKMILVKPHVT